MELIKMMNVALGTAQFGMDYGINNKRGKIPQPEVFEILRKAIKFGIDTLDTAYSYGESEAVIGDFMKSYQNKFKIISKFPECSYDEVKELLKSSLEKLGITSLYGYLVHNFESYKKEPRIWDELEEFTNEGKIEKIGFSFYFPSELEFVLSQDLKIDMVQIPFSILDQRFKPYFPELKKRKIEIYARSVFLQGLVFKKPAELDSYFDAIKTNLEQLNSLSGQFQVPIFALCLNFVTRNEFVDRAVVGVDNIEHFNQIILASNFLNRLDNLIPQLSNLKVDDEKIILPFNWDIHREARI